VEEPHGWGQGIEWNQILMVRLLWLIPGSKRPRSVVPEISADQCPALINWYLNEYWLLWHILGIVWKVFSRAFRRILDRGNRASIHGVMAKWSLWHFYCLISIILFLSTSILEHFYFWCSFFQHLKYCIILSSIAYLLTFWTPQFITLLINTSNLF